jgi:hypothetical protein
VYLVYVDENGISSKKHHDDYFSLGAVMIPEQAWAYIDGEVRKLKIAKFGNANVEIHSANLYKQKGEFKDYLESHCYEILREVYDLIGRLDMTLFSVLLDKQVLSDPDQDAELETWEMLLERIQLAVSGFCKSTKRDEYSMIIMDQKDQVRDERIRNYVKYCQIYGTEYVKPLDRIIDEPSFTPSKWRNLTQLADAVTYCFKNQYLEEQFFVEQFPKILSRYHNNGNGRIDGYGIKIRA